MFYELSAKVESNILMDVSFSVPRDDLTFDFRTDKEGRFTELAVMVKVPDELLKRFSSTIQPSDEKGVAARVSIGGDSKAHDRLVAELQELESQLAFLYHNAVRRIGWDAPTVQFIPETDEERELVSVTKISVTRAYPDPPISVDLGDLRSIVTDAPAFSELVVPMSFLREGRNAYRRFDYVLAFSHYFHVLEGFYAGGKTGKQAVLAAFTKSHEFGECCRNALEQLLPMQRHGDALLQLLADFACSEDALGLQKLLYGIRGRTHHFVAGSAIQHATPFNRGDYETIALTAGHLATLAIGGKVVAINQSRRA